MTDIVERLRNHATSDHKRGCAGRRCSCGYDADTKPLLEVTADEIERLRAEIDRLHEYIVGQLKGKYL